MTSPEASVTRRGEDEERKREMQRLRHAGLRYREIGERFGVTRQRAQQIVAGRYRERVVQSPAMDWTVEEAAAYLLRKVGQDRGLKYAKGMVRSETLRGSTFWRAVARCISHA